MEIQHKNIAIIGVLMALIGILLGAFGAHGLEAVLSPEKLASFEVGVRYQLYHGLALLVLSLLIFKGSAVIKQVASLIVIGTLLFSGSIYILSFATAWNFSPGFLVFITPLGGVLLIIGWLRLLVALLKKH